jgi:hypothetical protein
MFTTVFRNSVFVLPVPLGPLVWFGLGLAEAFESFEVSPCIEEVLDAFVKHFHANEFLIFPDFTVHRNHTFGLAVVFRVTLDDVFELDLEIFTPMQLPILTVKRFFNLVKVRYMFQWVERCIHINPVLDRIPIIKGVGVVPVKSYHGEISIQILALQRVFPVNVYFVFFTPTFAERNL